MQEDGGVEEDPEEHLVSSFSQNLICKIIYRSCVFIYMTWEERGGFMSRGAYILEIRRFLILYTVSLHTAICIIIIITSGLTTTHVVVSVRHPITY